MQEVDVRGIKAHSDWPVVESINGIRWIDIAFFFFCVLGGIGKVTGSGMR